MLSGADWMQSVPNERLGIPSIKMADGPIGLRSWAGRLKPTRRALPNELPPPPFRLESPWLPRGIPSCCKVKGRRLLKK